MRAVPDIKVEFPDLVDLRKAFREMPQALARKHLGAAIRRSLKPGMDALKGNVRRGPTGNLKRAIASKVKTYKSGNAAGLVGFVRAGSGKATSAAGGRVQKGKDRAFHAGFLEFGTAERFIKAPSARGGSFIASSFNSLGPFSIKKVSARQKATGIVPVNTTPKYPRAFFKKAAKGAALSLGEMPIGGSLGKPPIKSAFTTALPAMRVAMRKEMAAAIDNAARDLMHQFTGQR